MLVLIATELVCRRKEACVWIKQSLFPGPADCAAQLPAEASLQRLRKVSEASAVRLLQTPGTHLPNSEALAADCQADAPLRHGSNYDSFALSRWILQGAYIRHRTKSR